MINFPSAKINIGLDIIKKREDSYHNISSIFYPILSLTDILEITESTYFSFNTSGLRIPEGENLCEKAFRLLKEDFSFPNINIHLHKQIPIGAGLGGGSSDAAYTLKGINKLFNLNINFNQLKEYALQLGADCPFFIDNTPKYVEGIGDKMTSINLDLSNFEIKLINSGIHIPTKEAYSNVIPSIPEYSVLESIKNPINDWKFKIKNDFEMSIFERFPKLKSIKEHLYNEGAVYASMTGSGSSIYGIFAKSNSNLE
mgnify:CR=1 FL=1|tara:strand:- start:12795 stop:13562 length:768 start_codon:yes stop_codon:yes gene_type:complete